MPYQDFLGPMPDSPIGHDYDPSQPVQSFLATARGVAFSPREFFAALPRQGSFRGPLVFALLCAEVTALLGGIIGLPGHGLGWLIGSLITAAIGATIGVFLVSGIAHLLVRWIVGPANAGFAATFRAAAYSSVTDLASWIPVVGGLISLYGLYLAIVGIREVHQTTTEKAAMIVLIPVAVLVVLTIFAVVVAGAAFLSTLGGIP